MTARHLNYGGTIITVSTIDSANLFLHSLLNILSSKLNLRLDIVS